MHPGSSFVELCDILPPRIIIRITFTINDCINFRASEKMDWNYKKGDWSLFQTILEIVLVLESGLM